MLRNIKALCQQQPILKFQILFVELIYKLFKMNLKSLTLLCFLLTIAMSLHLTKIYKLGHKVQQIQLDSWRQTQLQKHNYLRSLHGCPQLALDDFLNLAALDYSQRQLSMHKMTHSPAARSGQYGQNLFWSWASPELTYTPGQASQSWYDEQKFYDYDTFQSNTPGQKVGHFTAMIWKSATTVGFGFAIGEEDDGYAIYVTANYGPEANVIGQYEENVPRPL